MLFVNKIVYANFMQSSRKNIEKNRPGTDQGT